MATFQDLQNRCQGELYNRTTLATQISQACLTAILHYSREKWSWSEQLQTANTVQGQPSIGLPTGFVYDDSMTLTYGNYPLPLVKRDWETMQRFLVSATTLQGPPTDYAYYAGQFWFYPTPSGVWQLNLWGNIRETALSAGTDTNDWTNEAEELARSRAVADIRCHILREANALSEMSVMAQNASTKRFMCNRERIAYESLRAFTNDRMSADAFVPQFF